ncbi:transcriptional regulator [Foetidibacter luteolus]|uniref:transcriptional regulator n=1 Tax=Foetidibacter luteolus TaxID=2608880 RepID=UPI00129B1F77|nr:transcriptional regulator [Foetidibacter luteolus]
MQTETWNDDVTVLYVTATSFPAGILAAHQQLHALIPFSTKRKYFGVSRPEDGNIVYRAAAEQLSDDEATHLKLDTLVLKKGHYAVLMVHDYMKDLPAIGKAFNVLLEQPGLDPQGYCVEWYLNDKDVKCMIRLEE